MHRWSIMCGPEKALNNMGSWIALPYTSSSSSLIFFKKMPFLLSGCVNLTRLLSKLADSGGYFRLINKPFLMLCLASFLMTYDPIKESANTNKMSHFFVRKNKKRMSPQAPPPPPVQDVRFWKCFRPTRSKERKEATRDIWNSVELWTAGRFRKVTSDLWRDFWTVWGMLHTDSCPWFYVSVILRRRVEWWTV